MPKSGSRSLSRDASPAPSPYTTISRSEVIDLPAKRRAISGSSTVSSQATGNATAPGMWPPRLSEPRRQPLYAASGRVSTMVSDGSSIRSLSSAVSMDLVVVLTGISLPSFTVENKRPLPSRQGFGGLGRRAAYPGRRTPRDTTCPARQRHDTCSGGAPDDGSSRRILAYHRLDDKRGPRSRVATAPPPQRRR